MIARLARSVCASALACLVATALLMLAFQVQSGDWNLHNTFDLGGALTVLAAAITAATCIPIFALLRRSAVLSTRGRASLMGAGTAWLIGGIAVAWFFADGFYPQGIGGWLRAIATPLMVPFVVAGTAFGYAWSSRQYLK